MQKLQIDRRTIDFVIAGEQQPEADHLMKMRNHVQETWKKKPGEKLKTDFPIQASYSRK